jgi:hypothetical protein
MSVTIDTTTISGSGSNFTITASGTAASGVTSVTCSLTRGGNPVAGVGPKTASVAAGQWSTSFSVSTGGTDYDVRAETTGGKSATRPVPFTTPGVVTTGPGGPPPSG